MSRTESVSPSLTAEENKDLKLAQKLLVNIISPDIAEQAALYGYKDRDHQEGWNLYLAASGRERNFSDSLSSANRKIIQEQRPVIHSLRALDQFENLWLPRTRALLTRKIDFAHREAFLLAFFDNLIQQPEGPAVLDSVSTLLDRIEALATNDTPGAKETFNILTERGLTPDVKQQTRDLIAQLNTFPQTAATSVATSPPVDPAAALALQREALAELVLWRSDWAAVFGPVFNYRILLRLGLRESKGGRNTQNPTPKDPI